MSNKEEILQFETDDKLQKSKNKSILYQNKLLEIISISLLFIIIFLVFYIFYNKKKSTSINKDSDILILKESDIYSIITMLDIISADKELSQYIQIINRIFHLEQI